MAEQEEKEGAEEKEVYQEERPKRKLPPKMLIVAAAALVVVAIGGVAYLKVLAPRMGSQATGGEEQVPAPQEGSQQASTAGEQVAVLGPMFKLDAFIVNLADEGASRYLKAKIELEMSNGTVAGELENRLPQVRDMILVLLTNKSFAEIRTSRGKAQIREEVIARLNGALTTGEVRQVYFTEFVVQ